MRLYNYQETGCEETADADQITRIRCVHSSAMLVQVLLALVLSIPKATLRRASRLPAMPGAPFALAALIIQHWNNGFRYVFPTVEDAKRQPFNGKEPRFNDVVCLQLWPYWPRRDPPSWSLKSWANQVSTDAASLQQRCLFHQHY